MSLPELHDRQGATGIHRRSAVHKSPAGLCARAGALDAVGVDFALYRQIAAQNGVFTTAQALEHCGDTQLRAHVRSGRWRRSPWRGVLLDGDVPDSSALIVQAAAMAVGGDLVACHSTAARLWGFDILGDATMHFLGPPSLVNRRLRGIQVHPSVLGTEDAVLREGVWCTPAARTACDVVRLTRPIDGLATLDAALRAGVCTQEQLHGAALAQAGLREVIRLRGLIPFAHPKADSPMESRMRWRFLDAGLPMPTLQYRIAGAHRAHFLDLGWEEYCVGTEFDGLEAHMTREQLDADRDRHNWVTVNRWTLFHFTAADIYRHHLAMVARTARALGVPFRQRS